MSSDISTEPFEVAQHLAAARQALLDAQVEAAREQAQQALRRCEGTLAQRSHAHALLLLAQCDRFSGKFRRVNDTAQEAALQFRLANDLAGEVEALILMCQACSFLGRDEEAVEQGLLAVELAELLADSPLQGSARNLLGVAYLWSAASVHAEQTLEDAKVRATNASSVWEVFRPSLNLVWCEALRLARDRYLTGVLGNCDELQLRMHKGAYALACAQEQPGPLFGGGWLLAMAHCAQALVTCWAGEPDEALAQLDKQQYDGPALVETLRVMQAWVRTEAYWAKQDWDAAREHAQGLVDRAACAEFEQMAQLGHLLLCQVYEHLGRPDMAAQTLRELRAREMRLRNECIDARHRTVQAQLEVRRNRDNLEHLVQYSRELERLSYEDALTGLPNRRRFEQALNELLAIGADPAAPGCVALVDVDNFKQVNDTCSHSGGDEVLKGVAQALRQAIRDADLAARLAGDEFVVLFPRTSLAQASVICERIRGAVAEMPWALLNPSLVVTVTVGVSQALPGDTAAALLHRADVHMFSRKRGPER